MTRAPRDPALPAWPRHGVLRVHADPAALPRLGDEPGTNRFDDPRPRTINRFLIRYAASSLRGCLLELLAGFRDDPDALAREAAVDCEDPEAVDSPVTAAWQHVRDYLANRQVARILAGRLSVVSVNDPALQRQLDKEPAVRAVLDSEAARAVLLEPGRHRVHLDNAAIRLSSEPGRLITQACSLALFDRSSPPDAIHYRSRHDDREDCWAVYHHARVRIGTPEPLSPDQPDHATALRSVARLWDLPLPPAWRT